IGMFGQCMKNMQIANRLINVQKRQNLIIPEQRSLNLFTKNPPRNVPPPPAGTTRTRTLLELRTPFYTNRQLENIIQMK
uniref:Uncharacterized protein n=1 Tax=Vombatus ursinus TaxID=29139 RepID=A0A4X2LE21_VOMUR